MKKTDRPNIVVLLADDMGYGDPRCYNPASLIPTPNIDRLAAEGTRFTDAHSACAICTPTRYGLLTGRYYWRTTRRHPLVMPYDPPVIEPNRFTLPGLLRGAGYRTGCFGKWHLGLAYPSKEGGFTEEEAAVDFSRPLVGGPCDCGFDTFYGTAGCSTSDPPYAFIEDRNTDGIPSIPTSDALNALPGFYPGLMVPDWIEEDVDDRLVDRAVDFIRSASQPFFLYVPISAPHNPWLPPRHAKGVSGEGPRGDMNVLVDRCVGRVYDALVDAGVLDETLLIFTSDNGPMRGENGQLSAGALRGYKNTAFEGGHRVPFVVRRRGWVAQGAQSDALVCLTDLPATLASLVGVDLPREVEDSHDVLDALLTEGGCVPSGRPTLVSDTGGLNSPDGDMAIRCGRWKLILLARDDDGELAERRLPVPDAVDGRLLFDLRDDPGECNNLVTDRPATAAWLERVLADVRRDGSRSVNPGPPPGVEELS